MSQKARNQIQVLNLNHLQNPVHNRKPVCKTIKLPHQVNRCQDRCQGIAVSVTREIDYFMFCLYPSLFFEHLNSLLEQLPSPYILV